MHHSMNKHFSLHSWNAPSNTILTHCAQYNIEIHDFSGHISSSEMIILPLVGFHFMKILGSAKQAKLTFVYYAHIGIMGLAEAMRIELDGKLG